MRTFAPGKLVLTGAYAVLEGAPAIAVAVSRGAYADSSRVASAPTPEVRAALGEASAPHVDASAMFHDARKLGLGASAAIVVATLAALEAGSGSALADFSVRERLFATARDAHARAQVGGSGVDVAASVHGGAIRYVMDAPVQKVALPHGLLVRVFACGVSARTSELRGAIDKLARAEPSVHRACMDALVAIANEAAQAVDANASAAFVDCLRRTARGLARLGDAAGVGIVPAGFEELEAMAAREQASFSVSGAGGGDVAVYVGPLEPSSSFAERARALGLSPVDLTLDTRGVRLAPALPAPAFEDDPRPLNPTAP
ncbi:MAG TPA: hypothetical protein VM580_24260 [Labilithrix sp.]|jgi:phosphomevalonate kinase|nr:hypothetical protein [Labilithrix sp.]